MRTTLLVALVLGVMAAIPSSSLAAVCSDYPNQAAAQAAGDTRDADGDGIYCESLPCPCSTAPPTRPTSPPSPAPPPTPAPVPDPTPTPSTDTPPAPAPAPAPAPTEPVTPACVKPAGVQNLTFSATKYPNIHRHFLRALRKGWPRVLVLNRPDADARRDRLLERFPTRHGYDRDEYPPAVGRGVGAGLTGGIDPRGWRADVAYVPSSENRSHGSTMGIKLRRFCDGTRFRYVFY